MTVLHCEFCFRENSKKQNTYELATREGSPEKRLIVAGPGLWFTVMWSANSISAALQPAAVLKKLIHHLFQKETVDDLS